MMTPDPGTSGPLPPLNGGERPSRLDLARHATGEIRLEGPLDEAWLRALEAERPRVEGFDWEILSKRAARLSDEPLPAAAPAQGWPVLRLLGLALAAFAFVLVMLPDLVRRPSPGEDGPTATEAAEDGLKGPPPGGRGMTAPPGVPDAGQVERTSVAGAANALPEADVGTLSWYVQRGDRQLRGTRSLALVDGDQVGFRLFAARYHSVVLAQVDAAGAVAPLDSQRGFTPLAIEPMQKAPLPVHFVVRPPVAVTVVAFFGEWTEARVRATVEEAWSTGGAAALRDLADDADDIAMVSLHTE